MTTPDTQIHARIAASFDRQGLMDTLGARLDLVERGRVIVSAPLTDAIRQQQGVAHAGASFALGDTAAGYAALSLMPADKEVVSIEVKINLIAPAVGVRLIAEGSVVRAGRQITVVRGDVLVADESGASKTVAVLQGTMMAVPTDRTPG